MRGKSIGGDYRPLISLEVFLINRTSLTYLYSLEGEDEDDPDGTQRLTPVLVADSEHSSLDGPHRDSTQ